MAEVSTGLTMIASTPEAMKLLIWSSWRATSFCASSTCRSMPLSSAIEIMPFLSTVRKLSSNSAIDTPTFCAIAEVDISETRPAAIRVFFMSFLPFGCPAHPCVQPEAPLPGAVFSPVRPPSGRLRTG